ncbi:helix-turn-helix domain-containing protein [Nonlabens antarcticus]|uniref:helix-turn-helix domain-containing protein n=1 Tax=Nonlabens antarcticus TaxID=392714 RepID=UPI001890CB48|nr:helix-turn-helix domain-containing protein [Nonlabens antarcticus]
MESIAAKIKQARIKKGMSQEELAEGSQISLRTVQRIESGQNEPRGKTLQLICETLQINIEDLLDYGKHEDRQFLMFFHLSVITGAFIPVGNIILPLVLWMTKKDKIVGLHRIGAKLLNFQLVWTFFAYATPILFSIFISGPLINIDFDPVTVTLLQIFGLSTINYLFAILFGIQNYRGKQITYPSIIPMIR